VDKGGAKYIRFSTVGEQPRLVGFAGVNFSAESRVDRLGLVRLNGRNLKIIGDYRRSLGA
jgi:hypothetical protein